LGEAISDGFEARLRRLKPESAVRAVVMLRRERPAAGVARSTAVRRVRKSALATLGEVDAILERFGGTRLDVAPNALGYVVVETTPAGIRALADSEAVRGVVEDQPVRLVS
jgi:hypothetical protein